MDNDTKTTRSQEYHFGFQQRFPTQDDAVRHAEWKEGEMKKELKESGNKVISSSIIRGKKFVQVEVKYI